MMSRRQSIRSDPSEKMAGETLDLFVSGTQKKVFENIRCKEIILHKTRYQKGSQADSNVLRKSKKSATFKTIKKCQVEIPWDLESNGSDSYQMPDRQVTWVKIVKKLPAKEEKPRFVKTTTQKLLPSMIWTPNFSRRGLLPDAFQSYLQKNLNLIAEIQTAKRNRSDNRHIVRTQEDNLNWTSNAPRSYGTLIKPLHRKKVGHRRAKKMMELPEGVQGIRLEGREPRKTVVRQPLPRSRKPFKRINSSEPRFCSRNGGKRVRFQLPNTKKTKKKKKIKKRRKVQKKKKSKVLSKTLCNKSSELLFC